MDNEIKRISISAFQKYFDNKRSGNLINVDLFGVNITIKPYLSLAEMISFVDEVVKNCYLTEDEVYSPEIKDYMIGATVLLMYTNIALPADVSERYDYVVRGRELINNVLAYVDNDQFEHMIDSIDEKIEIMNTARVSEVTKQMNEMYAMVDNLGEQFKGVFDGIGAGEMQKLVEAMSGTGIDEKKLVDAIVSQRLEERNG